MMDSNKILERYQAELEKRGIRNLDSLNENGIFSKELVNKDGAYESGYNGLIKVRDFNETEDIYNVEVIYVRTEANGKRLVCDNFNGAYIQADVSLIEDRDPVTLFEDYCKSADLFIEIQKEKETKRYMLFRATGVDEEERQSIISVEDQIINNLQQQLEASTKLK